MKRIAILCDGTWNSSDHEHPTNVVRLAKEIAHSDENGIGQVVHYVQGVGTGRGTGLVARMTDRFGGGAFGWGLMANIEEAYRFLVFAYEPGDEIFIFGFSRGAFTARSLAGLIRSAGIVSRQNVWMIPEALARYRSGEPKTRPDDEESFEFRLRWSPDVYTSDEEGRWRRALPTANANEIDAGSRLSIAYLGVWDTVGALGVPSTFGVLARLFNGGTQFHDATLSRCVSAARHAVAIDERRRFYPPTLWNNLTDLNERRPERPYRQHWFPGDHGSVGGGGDVVGLSHAALAWIARGAIECGLAIDTASLAELEALVDHLAPLRNSSRAKPGLLRHFGKDRDGPSHREEVSETALRRFREPACRIPEGRVYRPGSLAPLQTALLHQQQDRTVVV